MAEDQTKMGFASASGALEVLLPGLRDEHLTAATPCGHSTVGDLLAHLMDLAVVFRLAAEKAPGAAPGGPPASTLDPQWRDLLPKRVDELAVAWSAPAAWTGEASAAGGALVLPAAVMGLVTLNELVVHGWDIARATGQPYTVAPEAVEAIHGLVSQPERKQGVPGLFDAWVAVPADAPLLDHVIGMNGRDPGWTS